MELAIREVFIDKIICSGDGVGSDMPRVCANICERGDRSRNITGSRSGDSGLPKSKPRKRILGRIRESPKRELGTGAGNQYGAGDGDVWSESGGAGDKDGGRK